MTQAKIYLPIASFKPDQIPNFVRNGGYLYVYNGVVDASTSNNSGSSSTNLSNQIQSTRNRLEWCRTHSDFDQNHPRLNGEFGTHAQVVATYEARLETLTNQYYSIVQGLTNQYNTSGSNKENIVAKLQALGVTVKGNVNVNRNEGTQCCEACFAIDGDCNVCTQECNPPPSRIDDSKDPVYEYVLLFGFGRKQKKKKKIILPN